VYFKSSIMEDRIAADRSDEVSKTLIDSLE